MGTFGMWYWLMVIFWVGFLVLPVWRIVAKAGFSGAWSLLAFVPVVNFVMLLVFAFAAWPVEKPNT